MSNFVEKTDKAVTAADLIWRKVAVDAGLLKKRPHGADLTLSIGLVSGDFNDYDKSMEAAKQVFMQKYGLEEDEIPRGLVRTVWFGLPESNGKRPAALSLNTRILQEKFNDTAFLSL